MIYDKLEYAGQYRALPGLQKGLALLAETDFTSMEDGLYNVSDGLYFRIVTYRTHERSEVKPETHRDYIDIQYILSGTERVGYAPISDVKAPTESYPEKDLYIYPFENMDEIPLRERFFMILFPHDVHAPGVHNGEEKTVRKVIIKCEYKAH